MLSSLQGGRKENPLVVRKEAHFNKALLSLEKGKQAEKHVLSATQLCLHRLLASKNPQFLQKTMQKKKDY